MNVLRRVRLFDWSTWRNAYSASDYLVLAIIFATYVLTARLGFSIGAVGGFATLVWVPSGIAIASAVFSKRFVPAVFLAAFVANVSNGGGFTASGLIAIGNTSEALLAAYFLHAIVRFDRRFVKLSDVFGFVIFGAMLPTMVAATVGVTALVVTSVILPPSFGVTWLAWWVGDMAGVVIVAPFLLVWLGREDVFPGRERRSWTIAELMAFFVLFAMAMAFVFIDSLHPMLRRGPLASLIFLPHIWAAIRFGRRFTAFATLLSAGIALYATIHGVGPFASATQPMIQQIYFLLFFEIVMAVIVLLIATVVSARTEAEGRVLGLNATLVEAQSLANTGSWEYDLSTRTLLWSEEFNRILGHDAERGPRIKSAFAAHAHPEDKALVIEAMDAALERFEPIDISYRIVRPDNQIRYLHSIAKPVVGRWGVIDKVIGVTIDVTERRLAERVVEQQQAELEAAIQTIQQSDTAKTDFLAVLAHELRNPLAPIVSTIELMKIGETERLDEHVALIERQVTTMKVLLDDLLDLARISRKKVALAKKTVDIRVVVAHAIETAMPLIQARSHRLVHETYPDPLIASIDPVRTEQVLVNLLNNAAKYTEPGGLITIDLKKEGDSVAISIEDTGVGIIAAHMKSIFEPFSQVVSAETSLRSGVGVGLHLVKELVDLHGGTVSVESAGIGKGSTFTVRLPLSPVSSQELSVPENPPPLLPMETRTPILIVDDNEAAANALAKLLGKIGYDVTVAYSGKSALELLETIEPKAMLLDIGMPELDGYGLARAIRFQKKFRDTALVALTGYGQEDDLQRSRQAGFDAHLVKPVSIQSLVETIEKTLSR